MGLSKKHAAVIAPAMVAQGVWLFATYEAISLMSGLPSIGVERPPNFQAAVLTLATFGLARLVLTTWSLLTVHPSLWWLPIAAGAWETWIYTGQVSIAFGYFGDVFAHNLDLLQTALVTPGFRHFWLFPLASVFILPALALRSYSLFKSRNRRAA